MTNLSMSLKDYQDRVRSVVPEQFRYPRVFAALALVEELAELLAECLPEPPIGGRSEALIAELGDVLVSCAEIANEYHFSLDPPSNFRAQSTNRLAQDVTTYLLYVASVIGRIAKCVLDIECFDLQDHSKLVISTHEAVVALLNFSHLLGLNSQHAMDQSLVRIQGRIDSGEWQKKYGDTLLKKRNKFN